MKLLNEQVLSSWLLKIDTANANSAVSKSTYLEPLKEHNKPWKSTTSLDRDNSLQIAHLNSELWLLDGTVTLNMWPLVWPNMEPCRRKLST